MSEPSKWAVELTPHQQAVRKWRAKHGRAWYAKNRERILAREKELRWAPKNYERRKKAIEEWRSRNPEKIRAYRVLYQEKRHGYIKPPSVCALCQKSNLIIHAHHPDYSRPLYVCWLCNACHKSVHVDGVDVSGISIEYVSKFRKKETVTL